MTSGLGLLLSLTVFSIVTAGAMVLPKSQDNVRGNICCPPDLYNGTMYQEIVTFHAGSPSNVTKTSEKYVINADYVKKLTMVRGHSSFFGDIHMIVTPTFAYVIDEEKKICTINKNVPYYEKNCVTDDAVFVGDIIYGNLKTKAYRKDVEGFSAFGTVTADHCIPINVMLTQKSSAMVTTVTSQVFSDMRATVDRSALEIPPYCPTP